VAVVNFPPKRVAGFVSEVLVLGVVTSGTEVVLLGPDRPVTPGERALCSFAPYSGTSLKDVPLREKTFLTAN
jgi:tRNA-binding EMAP/Myf-like protein